MKHRAPRALSSAWLALTVLGAVGCQLPLSYGETERREYLLSRRAAVEPNGQVGGYTELASDRVVVVAFPRCNMVEREKVDVVSTQDRTIHEPILTAGISLVGVLQISGGVAIIASSFSRSEDDVSQEEFEDGRRAGAIVGSILINMGVAVLSLPMAQLIRAGFDDEQSSVQEVEGPMIARDVRCPDRSGLRRLHVHAENELGVRHDLGPLDLNGRMVVSELPVDLLDPADPTIDIFAGGVRLGEVDVSPLVARHEKARLAEAHARFDELPVARCVDELDREACREIRSFVGEYDDLELAERARVWLDEAAPGLRALQSGTRGAVSARRTGSAIDAAQNAGREAGRAACLTVCDKRCAADEECSARCAVVACEALF